MNYVQHLWLGTTLISSKKKSKKGEKPAAYARDVGSFQVAVDRAADCHNSRAATTWLVGPKH